MKKALIHLDRIVQVSDSTFEVHSSMKWVDCPDNCTTKWKYENEQFIENGYTDEEKLRGGISFFCSFIWINYVSFRNNIGWNSYTS